jgi:hypothetical protein
MLTRVVRHMQSYGAAYVLVALHFAGSISTVAIAVSCAWLAVHFVRRRNVDLYLVFVLLTPSIVFVSNDPDAQGLSGASALFDHFNSVVLFGPLALSTRLVLSLMLPVRVLLRYKQVRFRWLTVAWHVAVVLAAIGLVYSVMAGNKNPSGLTVGFRIALSIGAVLVPPCVPDQDEFMAGMDKILAFSMLVLVAGLTNGQWLFIAFGLIPYSWMRFKPRILALVPLAFAARILALQSSTLTGLGIILSSLTSLILIGSNRVTNLLLRRKVIMIAGLALPILLTVYVLSLPPTDRFDLTSLQGYAQFKLLGDRKPVWDASFAQIIHSSPLVVPAGNVMDVYIGFLDQSVEWTSGSHNIFLEIGRQIGALGMILLSVVMIVMLYRTGKRMRTTQQLVLFYCFLSIYVVFGVTGNSLVYDGVGAMYWLLVGQLYQTAAPTSA